MWSRIKVKAERKKLFEHIVVETLSLLEKLEIQVDISSGRGLAE